MTHNQKGRYSIVRSDVFKAAHLPDRCTLRYGVAIGSWQNVASVNIDTRDVRKVQMRQFRVLKTGARVTIGIYITVQIDTLYTGPFAPKTKFAEGPMTSFTCLLPENLTVDQVKELRLQTRPYQWAEFPNVSLHPAGKARSFISVGKTF